MYINAQLLAHYCLILFSAFEKPQETPRKRRLEGDEVGTPKAKRRRGVSTQLGELLS